MYLDSLRITRIRCKHIPDACPRLYTQPYHRKAFIYHLHLVLMSMFWVLIIHETMRMNIQHLHMVNVCLYRQE